MRLRNKKSGEIGTLIVDGAYKFVTNFAVEDDEMNRLGEYSSLAELSAEWEDYEEPKKYWYLTGEGDICRDDIKHSEWIEERKSIGNYFETEEEAEKAVEKLKAWKRLKDKGFRFDKWVWSAPENNIRGRINFTVMSYGAGASINDLNLLFGGGE